MREVLISIQPKWVEKIASGEKTVEVRKTKPKLETPFKCYIYCTKNNTFAEKTLRGFDDNGKAIYYKANKGKVIGEFVCHRIDTIGWISNPTRRDWLNFYNENSCLTQEQLYEYTKGNLFYEWHITDLVVYDEPRELSEFAKPAKTAYDDEGYLLCDGCEFANWKTDRVCTKDFCPERMITRAPQSWQFCVATEPQQTAD